MKSYCCNKCGSIDVFIDDRGNQKALMCGDCGAWLKWIGRKEMPLVERYINNKNKNVTELTMIDLEKCFEDAKLKKAKLIGVLVEMQDFEKVELIINRNENFDKKLEYYKSAYDDNLVLKTFKGIRIVGFKYSNSLSELEYLTKDM